MGFFTGYLGTYYTPESTGVYRLRLDAATGRLSGPTFFADIPDCKYLALRPDGLLAAPVSRGGAAGLALCRTPSRTPGIQQALTETGTSCYVALDDARAYTANFHEGTVLIYRLTGGAPALEARLSIQPKAGCHQVLLCGGRLLVPCMHLDEIRIFDAAPTYAPAGALPFPRGSGPRHGVLSPDGARLYVAAQVDNALYWFRVQGDAFVPEGRLPLLEEGQAGETAAIRITRDNRFLYLSVRGCNQLVCVSLAGEPRILQRIPCGGDHPRDIALSPDEQYLLAANRFSGDVVVFSRDRRTGLLGPECGRLACPQAVSLVFEDAMKG